jgi:hypothetical protein
LGHSRVVGWRASAACDETNSYDGNGLEEPASRCHAAAHGNIEILGAKQESRMAARSARGQDVKFVDDHRVFDYKFFLGRLEATNAANAGGESAQTST